MSPPLLLWPFGLFLIILPFPGTVAARLLLLAICFGIALWQWWRLPKMRQQIPCKPALAIWILVSTSSLAYAVDVAYTLGELKNELGYAMMAFFAFFTIASDLKSAIWLSRFLVAGLIAIGSGAASIWFAHGFWNESGKFGGSGVFATYLITITPVLAWLALVEPGRNMRRAALLAVAFACFVAVLTMQRALWPVWMIQALLALFLLKRAGRVGSRRRLAIAGVVVLVISVAGLLLSQHYRYGHADAEDANASLSTDTRLAFWPKVVATITEHPLKGSGFGRGSMRKAYPELVPASVPALWHAHNVFLNYGIGTGVPGVLALGFLFFGFFSLFWRASSGMAVLAGSVGVAIVTGVLMRNQFNDFFHRDMSLMFWALMGVFARRVTEERSGVPAVSGKSNFG